MNLVPYLGSAMLLVFAAGLIALTHLNTDRDGPLFEEGQRIELLLRLAACGIAFVAGWQL